VLFRQPHSGFDLPVNGVPLIPVNKAHDVIYVLELKKNFLSISIIEDRGFSIMINKGQVFIHPEGSIPDILVRIGVREGRLYKLERNPVHGSKGILDHGSILVIGDDE
jgi:hypothetical protein